MTSPHPALGIDYGEARIGIAATDPVGIMAHPVETIHRHQTDGISRIVQLVQERGIRTLVLGLPVRMDGTEGTAAAKVRAFGRELAAALPGLPLIFMDECLTTVIAQEKLHAAGKKAKNFRPIIDAGLKPNGAHAPSLPGLRMGTHFRCPDIQRKPGRVHDPRMAPQPHRILRDAPHHSLRTQTFPGKTAFFQNKSPACQME